MEIYLPVLKVFGGSLVAGIVMSYFKSFFLKPKSWITEILVNSLGCLFIFSGVVKAIDPLGTSYKMKDYFNAFTQFAGFSFDWLANMSTFLAVVMIVLEIVLGVALIIGFKKKWTLGLTAAMMVFFTVLTGFTYLTGYINPDFYDSATRATLKAAGEQIPVFVEYDKLQMKVTDCGCFGDFLKLEPKVTFIKDVFLLFVLAALFLLSKNIQPFFGKFFGWIKISGTAIIFLLFCFSNYLWGLPMVDFRPYKIGNDINELRIEIPDKLDYGFIFENKATGETKRVTMDEYAKYKADSTWVFTNEQDNKVLEAGVPAKISNFAAFDAEDFEVTDDVLLNEDYSFWVLSKSLDKSKKKSWKRLNEISKLAYDKGLQMYAFMAEDFEKAEEFRHEYQISYPMYQADETFIKTVVRANPGLVLLKNGVVKGKWHHNHLPSTEELVKLINQ
ncbi:MAG: DoxX family protein [Chitinophagales bacterium]